MTKYMVYIEDSVVDKAEVESMVETVQDDYPNDKIVVKTISLCCEEDYTVPTHEKVKNAVESADIIVFDYGGLCGVGLTDFVDCYNRFFMALIKEHPNKDWRCISALNTFEQPDREELESLGVNFRW